MLIDNTIIIRPTGNVATGVGLAVPAIEEFGTGEGIVSFISTHVGSGEDTTVGVTVVLILKGTGVTGLL